MIKRGFKIVESSLKSSLDIYRPLGLRWELGLWLELELGSLLV